MFWRVSAWLAVAFSGFVACTFARGAAALADEQVTVRPAPRTTMGGTLEHRVKVLTKALDLDERQQTELAKILEDQRLAVTKIWSDPSLLPAERAPATRAVQDRTADHIRGMLTDEQKKRYNPPKPTGAPPAAPNVSEWMETQARRSE